MNDFIRVLGYAILAGIVLTVIFVRGGSSGPQGASNIIASTGNALSNVITSASGGNTFISG